MLRAVDLTKSNYGIRLLLSLLYKDSNTATLGEHDFIAESSASDTTTKQYKAMDDIEV